MTTVRDLMSTPPLVCGREMSLAEAAQRMRDVESGSIIVVDDDKAIGILTERDLMRSAAARLDPVGERVGLWMTANPDTLGPEEEAGAAWSSLSHHHYRHLPVVDDGALVGVVSIRDLFAIASLRPADEIAHDAPRGLEGVVVSETTVGDVRGREGFFHYRQYSAVDLAEKRSLEDVWFLLFHGTLPTAEESTRFREEIAQSRALPSGLDALLPSLARQGTALDVLRTGVSLLGAELGWRPTTDIGAGTLKSQAVRLCALVPTLLTAAHRIRSGLEPLPPRPDLSSAANYLWMLTGVEPSAEHARAIEQYLVLTIDHGFNSSTFTARVITSTGADLAAAVCGAVGALSGPLHGGAPSRALDMLDQIGTPDRAEAWIRDAIGRGERIMGFGHRVYKTDDPRSLFLRDVARGLGGPLVDFACDVEGIVVDVLAELKPGHKLYANVEFFAGVVMDACGIPREMFTPTFASSRVIGWATHVMEQAGDNRLIRPTARYVGPPPPEPVPGPG
ncbi:MAG TPA: citrate/2-methylcitrate synthase [Acidimicrobiales bacterium]|nr:citrate/2-methylcitrate synthase [Acidimicrobiales bacterium]